jgi:uncharacterized membrane protein
MHRLFTLALAIYSFFLIKTRIPLLPARIPTHFNAAGEANGWGSPDTLWFLLLVQVLICGLLLAMPLIGLRYPGSVHLGRRRLSDFGPEVRERIMPLFTDMMGTMSVLLSLLFSFLLHEIIQAASSSQPHFSPKWELGLFLAGTAVTLIYYLSRIYAVTSEAISGSSSRT